MKNEAEALPIIAPAIETIPFTCFVSLNSGARLRTICCCFCQRRRSVFKAPV